MLKNKHKPLIFDLVFLFHIHEFFVPNVCSCSRIDFMHKNTKNRQCLYLLAICYIFVSFFVYIWFLYEFRRHASMEPIVESIFYFIFMLYVLKCVFEEYEMENREKRELWKVCVLQKDDWLNLNKKKANYIKDLKFIWKFYFDTV